MSHPYTYAEIVRYLEAGNTVSFTAFVPGKGKLDIRANVSWEWQRKLDNYPRNFRSVRESITYYPNHINVLDIDRNVWFTLPWKNILKISL